ncbi:unnamed protein product [Kluyveromyces dobzhanskii CBS 2104]|uniref:Ribonuclease H n=1 Tax=Kluyveromyces dobzhanskii CBS 2104 TaxID=1427455 RepID=A0A0A8LCG0_9SACH|nr:unnamed protein product [Kluyveromyces dobzhanskii CBS 2104]
MARQAFYAVSNGRSVGTFRTWAECQESVNGFPNARFKKFDTLNDANAFANGNNSNQSRSRQAPPSKSYRSPPSSYGQQYNSRNTSNGSSYYGVRSSNETGPGQVFDNWNDCKGYVEGRRNMSYKKFNTQDKASDFANGTVSNEAIYSHLNTTESQFTARHRIPAHHHLKVSAPQEPLNVYCDGSSLNNGHGDARAGYGVYFEAQNKRIARPLTHGAQTNNRAEISAVSEALCNIWNDLQEQRSSLERSSANGPRSELPKYVIHTDSEYVSKLLNDYANHTDPEDLRKAPNADLVAPMVENYTMVKQFYEVNKDIVGSNGLQVQWVKGHAGVPGNEIADQLAREGAMNRR